MWCATKAACFSLKGRNINFRKGASLQGRALGGRVETTWKRYIAYVKRKHNDDPDSERSKSRGKTESAEERRRGRRIIVRQEKRTTVSVT